MNNLFNNKFLDATIKISQNQRNNMSEERMSDLLEKYKKLSEYRDCQKLAIKIHEKALNQSYYLYLIEDSDEFNNLYKELSQLIQNQLI